ncbi:MAG TPA: hypothetical protein VIC62_14180 [Nakamurella sp.]
MTGRVGQDEQRLVRIVRAVQQLPRAERERPLPLPVELADGGHNGVQVQHLRPRAGGPGRRRVVGHLLERERPRAVGVSQHQPGRVRGTGTVGRWFVAGTVRRPNSCR